MSGNTSEKSVKSQGFPSGVDEHFGIALKNIYDELYEIDITQQNYSTLFCRNDKYDEPPASETLAATVLFAANYLIDERDRDTFLEFCQPENISGRIYSGAKSITCEVRRRMCNGDFCWNEISVIPHFHNDGDKLMLVALKDINEQKVISEKLKFQAEYDSLTGYSNFTKFKTDANYLIKNRDTMKYSLWYTDILNFKYINDIYGYEVGDSILRHCADELNNRLEKDETFARVTADNFIILIHYNDVDEIVAIFDYFRKYVASFEEICGQRIKTDIVSGVYCIEQEDDILNIEEMIDRANIARKSIKNSGGSRLAIYSQQMRDKIIYDRKLEGEMFAALENNEFKIYFQAQIDIQHGYNLIGAEALVRWKKNEDVILPVNFIPLFEKNGFIARLDLYVFEEVCKFLRNRLDNRLPVFKISVNVSRVSMFQAEFVEKYIELKRLYDLPDGLLELECTETIATKNISTISDIIREMRKNGFLFAMDDFGSGYSSLNVLKDISLDVLKLDMVFFRNGLRNERDRAIVASVVAMAKILKMQIVAEGVETHEQVTFLENIGCDLVQGYIFSRPVPMEKFDIEEITTNASVRENCTTSKDSEEETAPYVLNIYREIAMLVDNVLGGLVQIACDEWGTVLYANKSFYKLIGYTKEEFESLHNNRYLEIVEDSVNKLKSDLTTRLSVGKVIDFETKIRRKDGKIIWLKNQAKCNGDGTFYGFVMDITELKNMSQRLFDTNRELHYLTNNISGVILEMRYTDFPIIEYVNNQICELTGYEISEIGPVFANKYLDMIYFADIERVKKLYADAVETMGKIEAEYRIVTKDGEFKWVQDRSQTVKDNDGSIEIFTVLVDITAHKETEQELKIQIERYHILEETNKAMLFEYDVQKDIMTISVLNDAKKIVRKPIYHYIDTLRTSPLVHPDYIDEFKRLLLEACQKPTQGVYEYLSKVSDEKTYEWHRVHYSSIADDNGNIMRVIGRIRNVHNEVVTRRSLYKKIDLDEVTSTFSRKAARRIIFDALTSRKPDETDTFIVMDIENFNSIEDSYGKSFCNATLRTVADFIKRCLKADDIIGRSETNEFILYVKATSEDHVAEGIEAFCALIDSWHNIYDYKLTYHIGYTRVDDDDDLESIFDKADKALVTARTTEKKIVKFN